MIFAKIGIVIAVLALIAGGIWMWTSAPCSWYGLSAVKDTPARCLMR